jgi:sterol desaturase/sphingolipid hydroxylase (fatty acid hydroxylase superfamily)
MIAGILAIVSTLAVIATAEYLSHRLVMHHLTAILPSKYDRHAIEHHKRGRVDFDVDLPVWFSLLVGLPWFVVVWAFFGAVGLLAAVAVAAAHAILWTGLHRSFHDLDSGWATWLPGYAALRRHHLIHHRHLGKNFGGAFGPLLDWPLGTWAKQPILTDERTK